jgi:hypothetical protein
MKTADELRALFKRMFEERLSRIEAREAAGEVIDDEEEGVAHSADLYRLALAHAKAGSHHVHLEGNDHRDYVDLGKIDALDAIAAELVGKAAR